MGAAADSLIRQQSSGVGDARGISISEATASSVTTTEDPPKAIRELAGHSTLAMTLRYLHLAPSALREAIGLLDLGQPVGSDERTVSGTQ